jgi:type I restriction enzyme M protein
MNQSLHNKLVSFIWSIADDCLRDVYVRGKYRDVILPMVVLRRLDALLEPTKKDVLEELAFQKEEAGFTEWDEDGLKDASGYVFYNTSKYTLKQIYSTATNSRQILIANFEDYLDGFSPNVREIIDKFNLKSQIRHMAGKDILLNVLEKFTSPYINLTPYEREDPDGKIMPGLSNLGMGYVFEELIRRFNEENNEEAGEHFTPREVIDLMTHLIFEPMKDDLPPVITIYDPACGSGGMLTESQNFIKDQEGEIKATGDVYLYGKEINDETYAICKSDMMIKGNEPDQIKLGSTLSTDEFSGIYFDFMLSNPPYGKSWSYDAAQIKDGKDIVDKRFEVRLENYWGKMEDVPATPRTSDGQLLFLMEMVDKMKSLKKSEHGSRIASVHNGSSLFTGDAGSGESNIRRYIIENDLLEAIIQMPNNLFYNTGITTYIWLLSNNKSAQSKGKVLLIDASEQFAKLRKNLGNKNCEFKRSHIDLILDTYRKFENTETEDPSSIAAKVFDNEDLGYYKVTIERPERLKTQFCDELIDKLKYDKQLVEPMQLAVKEFGDDIYQNIETYKDDLLKLLDEHEIELNKKKRKQLTSKKLWEKHLLLYTVAKKLQQELGNEEYDDYNQVKKDVDQILKAQEQKISSAEKKTILQAVSWYDENAAKVIKKKEVFSRQKIKALTQHLGCDEKELPDHGYYPARQVETGYQDEQKNTTPAKNEIYITYEPASELRDFEHIPLKQDIHQYFTSEVKPHVQEAWIDLDKTKIGYEISFNKYFYQHKPLRPIEEVSAEILELEKENEGLIMDILNLK